MRITDITTTIAGNPWKNWLFVTVHTDEGLRGLGEATSGLHTRPVEAALARMKPLCIGRDPRDITGLMETLRRALFLSEDGVVMTAMSGLNIACWDILARSLNAPLYRVLGGACRPRVRAYANGWYQGPRDPAAFADRAAAVVARGYTALKFDPFGAAYGFLDAGEERLSLAIVRAVREAAGAGVDILIEAHDRFAPSTAVRLGRLLEEFRPMWYETPVLSTDIAATRTVARAVNVPVASGERFTTTRQIAGLLDRGVVSIVQPETLRIGGVSGILESCAVAAAFGAWVAPHNAQSPLTTAVNTHVGMCAANVLIQECFDDFGVAWARDVVRGAPAVINGYLEATDRPGIGVELDEREAARHPCGEENFLRLFEPGWERRRMS